MFAVAVIDEPAAIFACRDDAAAGADRYEIRALRMQQREKCAACHAEAEQLRRKIGIAHIHDLAICRIRSVQPLDTLTTDERCIAQIERFKHAEPGRLQQESGTDRMQFRAAFVDVDRVAGACEEDRGGLACGSVADDCDLHSESPRRLHCSGWLACAKARCGRARANVLECSLEAGVPSRSTARLRHTLRT